MYFIVMFNQDDAEAAIHTPFQSKTVAQDVGNYLAEHTPDVSGCTVIDEDDYRAHYEVL